MFVWESVRTDPWLFFLAKPRECTFRHATLVVHDVMRKEVVPRCLPFLLRCTQATYFPPCLNSLRTFKTSLAHLLRVFDVTLRVCHNCTYSVVSRCSCTVYRTDGRFSSAAERVEQYSSAVQCLGPPLHTVQRAAFDNRAGATVGRR